MLYSIIINRKSNIIKTHDIFWEAIFYETEITIFPLYYLFSNKEIRNLYIYFSTFFFCYKINLFISNISYKYTVSMLDKGSIYIIFQFFFFIIIKRREEKIHKSEIIEIIFLLSLKNTFSLQIITIDSIENKNILQISEIIGKSSRRDIDSFGLELACNSIDREKISDITTQKEENLLKKIYLFDSISLHEISENNSIFQATHETLL